MLLKIVHVKELCRTPRFKNTYFLRRPRNLEVLTIAGITRSEG